MNTPESKPEPEPVAVVSSDWFGSGIWTAADLLGNAYLSDIERWWEAWKGGKHHQFVRVRLDIQKQEYVLDAVGQELRHSEELWRYKHGGWTFRSALPNTKTTDGKPVGEQDMPALIARLLKEHYAKDRK